MGCYCCLWLLNKQKLATWLSSGRVIGSISNILDTTTLSIIIIKRDNHYLVSSCWVSWRHTLLSGINSLPVPAMAAGLEPLTSEWRGEWSTTRMPPPYRGKTWNFPDKTRSPFKPDWNWVWSRPCTLLSCSGRTAFRGGSRSGSSFPRSRNRRWRWNGQIHFKTKL